MRTTHQGLVLEMEIGSYTPTMVPLEIQAMKHVVHYGLEHLSLAWHVTLP